MIIAITGTPGTGKTSVCKVCKSRAPGVEYAYIDLNSVIEEQGFYTGIDHRRGCLIADLDKLEEYVQQQQEQKRLIIEGHLAHLLNPDVAIVLRASPPVLAGRLKKKGFSAEKINENVEAEMLDVILIEAVELCKTVYELDTSVKSIEEVAAVVQEIIDVEVGEIEESERRNEKKKALMAKYKPGSVDWTRFITLR